MQTARRPDVTAWVAAVACTLVLMAGSAAAAPGPEVPTIRPFPEGRVIGTGYFGTPLNWHDPAVKDQILVADFLALGDGLAQNAVYEGFVDAMHAEKPTIKIFHTFIVPWIFDPCATVAPPGSLPCEELGRRIYNRFWPQDIAHTSVANPSPAVGDTAFHIYGTYMLDIDNPGVAEALADIFYTWVQEGNNPDIDGVNLDYFQADWGGWSMYGNRPGDVGYTGDPNRYTIDMDRDGIPSNQDPGELLSTRDAYGRFVNRLRFRFGPTFLISGNGLDALYNSQMSNGQMFHDLLDVRQRELFPYFWAPNDYFLPAFDIEPNGSYDGQNVWELADSGYPNPYVHTPTGSYILLDTLNGPNGPWICLSALMLDNAVAYLGGNNMNEGRTQWWAGDPMPLLDGLGAPLGPPVRDDRMWSRSFAGGSIQIDFTNSPAELFIEPYHNGQINAPNGPFKYLVLGASPTDTLYRGGGWPRAAAAGAPALVHAVNFEDTRWTASFGGGNSYVARVANLPHGGTQSLRGNLKPGLQDPIAHVAGNADPLLQYDAEGGFDSLTGDIYLRYWWRWDNFTWNGSALGCGVTTSLVDAITGQPALSLSMGYLPAPGRGGATGGQLDIQIGSAFTTWGVQNWGSTVARLGSSGAPTLLPLDGDWHEVEILLDHAAGRLSVWVDDERLGARPGDANGQAHYPDGRVPVPPTFRWHALRFASATATQVNLSTNGSGYAVGWQVDDIELYSGFDPNPGQPGRPVIIPD